MLIGDYEISDLQDTTGVTILFIIFTGIGVIILLNVLIAVVSDSYEKATINSAKLFGRARAMFVAQNEALERFLKPGSNLTKSSSDGGSGAPSRLETVFALGRWIVLLVIIGTALDTTLYLWWVSIDSMKHFGDDDYISPLGASFSKFQVVVCAKLKGTAHSGACHCSIFACFHAGSSNWCPCELCTRKRCQSSSSFVCHGIASRCASSK